ncbi:MAG: signal transduction histidine kinase/AraC-like DNA-binding protein, partial [Thalassolituus oleivorans]
QSVIFDTDLITLGPTQNFFSFGFAALHFSNPSQNRYSYRLEGFDPEWHDAGTVRSASYTNVDPGTYVFRVRAANSAGIWNMEGAAVRVIVLPPWWQTLWAYGLAGLFLVAFVVGLDRYQRRRLVRIERQKSEFRETRLRAELAEERTRSVQQISNLRERFFANVAHEFRTPLTLVLGPLEDMAARSNSATDPDTVEDVELALRNVNRLNRLVNELLDVARLEADRLILERRPADFVAFVAEVAGAFLPLAERTGRVFELRMPDTSIPVMMDSVQMEKVLLNLLSNAFKFAAAEGTIRVTVDQPNQGSVAVRVFNTGPGISQDRLSRLFDRFYQNEDARHLGQVGSGIGLSLVRDLTALHEGSVVAESQDGVGVTFSVLLPRLTGTGHEGALIEHASLSVGTLVSDLIAAEEENQKVPDVQIDLDDPEVTARPTILVVDDHVGIRALIRRRLEPTYRVVEAVDGVDGLERIRRLLPDLVISDVMMPRMDGYGLCTAVKADPEISFVPIILLTALAAREYRITGWETGADAYLAKPFDDRELMSVVVNQIAASHRLKERLGQELRSQAALDGTSSDPDRATSGKPTSAVDQLQSSIDDVFARHYVDEDFGVDDLAEALGMSRMTLYRNVDKLSEGSPAELLRSYRLARAAEMLVARSGTVGEICYACGFRNLAHFCRVFKSEFQCTPSAYARGVC